jgi:hypothetical protein
MNIQAEKLRLIEWIAGIQDEKVIKKLVSLQKDTVSDSDWWDEISDFERKAINKGLQDIKEGKVHPNSKAKKLYEKYL